MKAPLRIFHLLTLVFLLPLARLTAAQSLEITLVPEKAAILPDEPIYVTLVIKNKSTSAVPLGDYADANTRDFNVDVDAADGHSTAPPRQPGFLVSNIEILVLPSTVIIPPRGEYTYLLFLPTYALLDKTGTYTITVRNLKNSFSTLKSGKNAEATASYSTTIKVLPPDHDQMGQLIDSLGKQMLTHAAATTNSDDRMADLEEEKSGGHKAANERNAMARLLEIHDERVIPWMAQACKSRNFNIKLQALDALGKYKEDSALDALKAALKTTPEEIHDTTLAGDKTKSAETIHMFAARAMSSSPNPNALSFLLTLRNDPDPWMRRIAMGAVAEKIPPAEAIPILREMTNDKDASIAEEARGYLRAVDSTPATGSKETK